jgi:hypothetical protein
VEEVLGVAVAVHWVVQVVQEILLQQHQVKAILVVLDGYKMLQMVVEAVVEPGLRDQMDPGQAVGLVE